jgi:hypothetical protein
MLFKERDTLPVTTSHCACTLPIMRTIMGEETVMIRYTIIRLALPLIAAGLCAGCGLAGTAVATGAGAAAEVQEAQQAKATEDRVKRELAEAQQAAAQQRSDAESQGK